MSDERPEIYIVFDDSSPLVAYLTERAALEHASACTNLISGGAFHVRRVALRGEAAADDAFAARLERLACAAATLPLGTLFRGGGLNNAPAYDVTMAAVRYFRGEPSMLDWVAARQPGPDLAPGERKTNVMQEYASECVRSEIERLHRVIESVSRDLVAAEKREDENFKRWQTAVDQHATERMRRQIMQQRLRRLADNPDATLFTVEQLHDIADEKEPTR